MVTRLSRSLLIGVGHCGKGGLFSLPPLATCTYVDGAGMALVLDLNLCPNNDSRQQVRFRPPTGQSSGVSAGVPGSSPSEGHSLKVSWELRRTSALNGAVIAVRMSPD